MAKTTLPTNYVDDVLNGAMDGKRRYREIPNADGTISLEDATTYDQIGNNFGASQVNLMNDNINQSFDANKMLKTMDEVNAVTQEGYGVDALVVKELNNSLTNENSETFNFGVLNGVRGFFTNPSRADDSFIPFNSIEEIYYPTSIMEAFNKNISLKKGNTYTLLIHTGAKGNGMNIIDVTLSSGNATITNTSLQKAGQTGFSCASAKINISNITEDSIINASVKDTSSAITSSNTFGVLLRGTI